MQVWEGAELDSLAMAVCPGDEWFLEKTSRTPPDCELQEGSGTMLVCLPCPSCEHCAWHMANTQSPCLDNLHLQ